MKQIKGSLVICRSSDGNIYITVEADNGLKMSEICLTPEQYGNASTGLWTSDVDIKVFGNYDLVDKVREHKLVLVPLPEGGINYKDYPTARKLLEPFEVDGWKGRVSDVLNHNMSAEINGAQARNVLFERYV